MDGWYAFHLNGKKLGKDRLSLFPNAQSEAKKKACLGKFGVEELESPDIDLVKH